VVLSWVIGREIPCYFPDKKLVIFWCRANIEERSGPSPGGARRAQIYWGFFPENFPVSGKKQRQLGARLSAPPATKKHGHFWPFFLPVNAPIKT
jgi:hypothetical protein